MSRIYDVTYTKYNYLSCIDIGYVIAAIVAICIAFSPTTHAQTINTANICNGVANNTVLPNNDHCTQFFICSNGDPKPNTCPSGQWFNPTDLHCDSSEDAKCNPSNKFECPKEGIYFYPHDDCDKFIMCFAGFPIVSDCADGLHFDRESLKCDKPEIAECQFDKCPEPTDGPFEFVFLPSRTDCEK